LELDEVLLWGAEPKSRSRRRANEPFRSARQKGGLVPLGDADDAEISTFAAFHEADWLVDPCGDIRTLIEVNDQLERSDLLTND
jgi:hypothetical protein